MTKEKLKNVWIPEELHDLLLKRKVNEKKGDVKKQLKEAIEQYIARDAQDE